MQDSLFSPPVATRGRHADWRSRALSAALHAVLLAAFMVTLHRASHIAPYRLPGTAQGTRFLVSYHPGSPEHAASATPVKKQSEQDTALSVRPAPAAPKPLASKAPPAEAGSGSSALSGLGEGDISIALQKNFPYPRPDLSTLPHGTIGDVILNAVIDEHGKIAELTLIKGLGPPIDDVVVATVKEWLYSPATRNGVPVSSEQELHFHFQRS